MIKTEKSHLYVSTATHEGMRGKNNEDRFGVSAYYLAPGDSTPSLFAVLCDGIGGHRAGEVAAEIAVETVSKAVADSDASQPLETLRQGIQTASVNIRSMADQDSERKGMGATCVAAWVIADRLYMAYVGDSRMYLMRNGTIRQLTIDHTWIQEALDYGILTPEQARHHPNQHVIRRYLGSQEVPEVDFRLKLDSAETPEQSLANQGLHLLPGDFLLLCSDGLSDLVNAEEVQQAVQSQGRQRAPQFLVNLANQRGGHDNITVVLLEFPGLAAAPAAPAAPTSRTQVSASSTAPTVFSAPASRAAAPRSQRAARHAMISCLAASFVIIFILAMSAGLLWYASSQGILQLPWVKITTTPTITAPALPFPRATPTQLVPILPSETMPVVPLVPTITLTPWPTNTPPPSTVTSTSTRVPPTLTPTLTPTSAPTLMQTKAIP